MNLLLQHIINLFNSISFRLIMAVGSLILLLHAFKGKFSSTYKAYQRRKGLREIEKQMWWIE
ncbi:MAG: hypothetical protein V4717_20665 [Bacteroidota bacterium]